MAEEKKKRGFKVPHVFTLLMLIILVCGILSYIIPAGVYDRVEDPGTGRMVVDPDSYHRVEQTPVKPLTLFAALNGGMSKASGIIFFVFVVGSAIGILAKTGAMEAGIMALARALRGKEILVIPVMTTVVFIMALLIGTTEEMIPLIPFFIALSLACGFDSLIGQAMVSAACAGGFACSVLNPFNVGVAQGIAQLPAYSGSGFRIVMAVVYLSFTLFWLMRYASKIKKNPELSPMYEEDKLREEVDADSAPEFTTARKLSIVAFAITVGVMIFGVIKYGWYFEEISAIFLIMAIVVAIINKMGFSGFGKAIAEGMTDIATGALVVGIATGVLWILEQGNILDAILHGAATVLQKLPAQVSAIGMYVFQCLMNYLIPSGSGQAGVTMPILAPLADLTGVTRQTAVIAFQLGDGISNAITPTSGPLMAMLGLSKIPWTKWAKWYLPLMLCQYGIGLIFVIIAQAIHLGPF
ncbi:MAG: YfcC family protein [Firmicutes bacterium]|nr:YfcC family protein [Bacillota bacterium]